MTDSIYLGSFNFFRWVILHTPRPIKRTFIDLLAGVAYCIDFKHRKYAKANLDLAFGDTLDEISKKEIIKKTYKNLLYLLADFVENQGIDQKDLLKKVTFKNEEIVDEIHGRKNPVIFITAHYGNWELLALAIAARRRGISVVGRPLDSKAMDKILKRNREQFDIRLISKYGALRPLMKELKAGRDIGLLVDQSVRPHEGIDIDFFGHKATHTTSVALLSRKFDIPIVPVFISTEDHEHYTMTFYPPIEPTHTDDIQADIRKSVEAQAKITEEVIRKKPDEWFWFHKRWKIHHGEIYE
ncbi:lipid A biosynthesis lauroyl acyltransferase [Hydrogenimonas sp.]